MFKWHENEDGGSCTLGSVLVGGYVNWAESGPRYGIPARRWFWKKDPIQATAYFETDTKHIDLGSGWFYNPASARYWIEHRVEEFLSQKDAA